MGRPPHATDNGSLHGPNGRDAADGCCASHSRNIARSLSHGEWLAIAKHMKLSAQQGDIVRLLMTLPGGANSNSHIALAMTAERKARLERLGRTLRPADEDGRRLGNGRGRGEGPVPVGTVDTQMERIFAKLGVHSRMELAQRVDYEIAVMRGWIL